MSPSVRESRELLVVVLVYFGAHSGMRGNWHVQHLSPYRLSQASRERAAV